MTMPATVTQRAAGRLRWRLLATWMAMLLLVSGVNVAPTSGQSSFGRESRLKAAFVYNFTLFAQWPTNAFVGDDDPFVIGVIGRDPFDGNLEPLVQDKRVAGHLLKVMAISAADAVHLASVRAHLLFVARSESSRAGSLVEQVRRLPILTISDIPEFAHLGGMIEMYEEGGTLRFAINPASAEQAGLTISSRLLTLARITATAARTSGLPSIGDHTQ
jgi:hypothetical protein